MVSEIIDVQYQKLRTFGVNLTYSIYLSTQLIDLVDFPTYENSYTLD